MRSLLVPKSAKCARTYASGVLHLFIENRTRRSHHLLLMSLTAVLAACDPSQPVAPASAGTMQPPAFGTGNGPATPGHSFVLRFDEAIFLTSADEAQDLVVRHYSAEDIDFCGGSAAEPTAEAQLVLTPKAAVFHWRTGKLPVYIYRLSEVPPQEVSPEFCADLVSKWIYRGTHQLFNHDNNLFFDPTRTNSFGWHATGKVFDRSGRKYQYLESLSAVVDPDPFRIIRERYKLSIR
jgi:hypothetical protein